MTAEAVTNPLEIHLNKQLLKYAVQKQIFCSRSGDVLDVRTAVAVTFKRLDEDAESTVVMIGKEWDLIKDRITTTAAKTGIEITVLDGRELHKRKRN